MTSWVIGRRLKSSQRYLKFFLRLIMGDRSDDVEGHTRTRERMAHGNVYALERRPDRVCVSLFRPYRDQRYLSMLSRPENVVYFFHKVVGIPLITKEVLVQRTHDYQRWVEGFARNHNLPMQWAEKGVKKEEFVEPWLRRMERAQRYGVYFIFQSMEQGATLRSRQPKFATADPNYQILSKCRSRFTHYYFYICDPALGA